MNVVMVSNTTPEEKMGGLPRYARELAGALVRAGVEVTLLVKRVTPEAPELEIAPDGVRIIRHRVPSKANPLFALGYPLYTASGVLGPVHRRRRSDLVVHGHFAVTTLPLALTGVPFVYTFHAPRWRELLDERQGTYELPRFAQRPAVGGLRAAERIVVSRARRTFVLSEFMRGQLRALSPRAADAAERLGGGIDLGRFAPGPDGGRASAQAPLLLTVRRLTPRTGVDQLIAALPAIRAAHPETRLAIAGVGEMEPALRSLAGRLGLSEQVRFLGSLTDEELVSWYRRATLVAVPTARLEGFGLTIAEALACETPVVGTPVGAIPEILGALDPELVCAESSPPALAESISRLLSAPERLRELGLRGRALVAPAMGWDAIARRYLDAYSDLLRRQR
jgi:glycosyltransferase involved in cell wall biosynthesis